MRNNKLFKIAAGFNFPEKIESINKFGDGLINDTYLVKTIGSGTNNYLLQRINNSVFKSIDKLTENKVLISEILSSKIKDGRITPVFIPSHEQNHFFLDNDNEYWNLSLFIENTVIYQNIETKDIAFEAGKILGGFHQILCELPINQVYETIPDFHNLYFRLEQFDNALKNDEFARIKNASQEIDFIQKMRNDMLHIPKLIEEKQLPIRIVHNDTKINNILFNKRKKGICYIDLDTVMPGTIVYDFGDAMRSGINNGKEDDANLKNVFANIELYKHFVKAYISKTKDFIEEIELKNLVNGVLTITFEQSVRFLTDYLNGDKYYKTNYDDHNLIRTKAQLELLKSFIKNKSLMENVIKGT